MISKEVSETSVVRKFSMVMFDFFFPLVSLNLILGINSGLIRLSVYFVGCVVNHSVDQAMFFISPDQILEVD